MPGSDSDIRVVPSVLDRLTDESPRETAPETTRVQSVSRFREAVGRDLLNLLNSSNPFGDLSEGFVEARQSVLAYGLSTMGSTPLTDRERIRQDVRRALELFEPRLSDVVVELEDSRRDPLSLRLRVFGRLLIEPSPEPVSFDLVMPVETHRFKFVQDAAEEEG